MKRRGFLKRGLTVSSLAAVSGATGIAEAQQNQSKAADFKAKHTFKLKYTPHFGMFKNHAGDDPIKELQFMAEMGFKALEDNELMGRPVELQEKIGRELQRLGMTMGVFVIDGGDNWKTSLASGKREFQENFLKTCRTAVEVAKRVNAKWATMLPGFFDRSLAMGYQTAHVIDTLRRACEILEPHGLVMVMEPLSDTPTFFSGTPIKPI